jgi:hypothetical protein
MSFQNFQTECIEIATIQPGFEAEGRRLGMQPGDRFPDVFTMAWEYAAYLGKREPSVDTDDPKQVGLEGLRRQADRLEGKTVETLRVAARAGDGRAMMDLVDVLTYNMLRVRDTDRRSRAAVVEEFSRVRHDAERLPGNGRSHMATALLIEQQVEGGARTAASNYGELLRRLEAAARDGYECPALLFLPTKIAAAGLFRPSAAPHLVELLLRRDEECAEEERAAAGGGRAAHACAGPGCSISATKKAQLFKCPLCRGPHYCSDACFDRHWRGGHKEQCPGRAPKGGRAEPAAEPGKEEEKGGAWAACSHCGQAAAKLRLCGGCKQRQYCGQECQRAAWKSGHRGECKVLARAEALALECAEQKEPEQKASKTNTKKKNKKNKERETSFRAGGIAMKSKTMSARELGAMGIGTAGAGLEAPPVAKGSFVELHGLQANPGLNGTCGIVLAARGANGRFTVRCDMDGVCRALKPSNLRGRHTTRLDMLLRSAFGPGVVCYYNGDGGTVSDPRGGDGFCCIRSRDETNKTATVVLVSGETALEPFGSVGLTVKLSSLTAVDWHAEFAEARERFGSVRLQVGDRVRARRGFEDVTGTIVSLYHQEDDWPDERWSPYQILVDGPTAEGSLICAPSDHAVTKISL